MNLFDDKELAAAVLALGVGEFDKGHGCPDGYVMNQNIHPIQYFVKSPAVAMALVRLVIDKCWAIHPMKTALGTEYQCMVVKVQGVLRSPYVCNDLEKSIVMACVEALTTDHDGQES